MLRVERVWHMAMESVPSRGQQLILQPQTQCPHWEKCCSPAECENCSVGKKIANNQKNCVLKIILKSGIDIGLFSENSLVIKDIFCLVIKDIFCLDMRFTLFKE